VWCAEVEDTPGGDDRRRNHGVATPRRIFGRQAAPHTDKANRSSYSREAQLRRLARRSSMSSWSLGMNLRRSRCRCPWLAATDRPPRHVGAALAPTERQRGHCQGRRAEPRQAAPRSAVRGRPDLGHHRAHSSRAAPGEGDHRGDVRSQPLVPAPDERSAASAAPVVRPGPTAPFVANGVACR
jgi:hypothetical protein